MVVFLGWISPKTLRILFFFLGLISDSVTFAFSSLVLEGRHENNFSKLDIIIGLLKCVGDGLEWHKGLPFAVKALLFQVFKDMDSSLVELSFVDLSGDFELETDALSEEFATWSLQREISLERVFGLRVKCDPLD